MDIADQRDLSHRFWIKVISLGDKPAVNQDAPPIIGAQNSNGAVALTKVLLARQNLAPAP